MSGDTRESIAANIDARAEWHEGIADEPNARTGDVRWHRTLAQWLRELADEVRAGVL